MHNNTITIERRTSLIICYTTSILHCRFIELVVYVAACGIYLVKIPRTVRYQLFHTHSAIKSIEVIIFYNCGSVWVWPSIDSIDYLECWNLSYAIVPSCHYTNTSAIEVFAPFEEVHVFVHLHLGIVLLGHIIKIICLLIVIYISGDKVYRHAILVI